MPAAAMGTSNTAGGCQSLQWPTLRKWPTHRRWNSQRQRHSGRHRHSPPHWPCPPPPLPTVNALTRVSPAALNFSFDSAVLLRSACSNHPAGQPTHHHHHPRRGGRREERVDAPGERFAGACVRAPQPIPPQASAHKKDKRGTPRNTHNQAGPRLRQARASETAKPAVTDKDVR